MSWQAYIDTSLLGSGKVSQAVIFGHDGNTWAHSPSFTLSSTEATTLLTAFKDASSIRANGLYLNGIRFITLRADTDVIYGKKEGTGVVCTKTKKAVIVGYYGENMQPGDANTVVEKLADYLKSMNY